MESQYGDWPKLPSQKVIILQKIAVRVVGNEDFLAHTGNIFSKLKILKCADQYLLNLASLMWDYDHDEILKSLNFWLKNQTTHTTHDLLSKVNLNPVNITLLNLVFTLSVMKALNYLMT